MVASLSRVLLAGTPLRILVLVVGFLGAILSMGPELTRQTLIQTSDGIKSTAMGDGRAFSFWLLSADFECLSGARISHVDF
jgi:hypothetical protein